MHNWQLSMSTQLHWSLFSTYWRYTNKIIIIIIIIIITLSLHTVSFKVSMCYKNMPKNSVGHISDSSCKTCIQVNWNGSGKCSDATEGRLLEKDEKEDDATNEWRNRKPFKWTGKWHYTFETHGITQGITLNNAMDYWANGLLTTLTLICYSDTPLAR